MFTSGVPLSVTAGRLPTLTVGVPESVTAGVFAIFTLGVFDTDTLPVMVPVTVPVTGTGCEDEFTTVTAGDPEVEAPCNG